MTEKEFSYRLRIDTLNRYSIIRFPNESEIYRAVMAVSNEIPLSEFYSVTRTAKEISVIQNARYPTYPPELGESLHQRLQVEEGFVVIEAAPCTGSQIDFCTYLRVLATDWHSGDGIPCTASNNFG